MRIIRITLATLVCLSLASAASARTRDYLMCYKSKAEFGGASTHLNDDNDPNNPGGANSFDVKKALDLCVPATAGAYPVLYATAPLALYSAKRAAGHCTDDPPTTCKSDDDCDTGTCTLYTSKFNKKDARNLSVRVRDGEVDTRVNVSKELGLMAPTNFGPVNPGAGERDYYKCYGVKATKASCVGGTNAGELCKDSSVCGGGTCTLNPKLKDSPVVLDTDDALATATRQELKKLKMICQAATKDSEGIVAEGTALACYATKQQLGLKFSSIVGLEASNDIGGTAAYEVKKRDVFCTPACVGELTDPPVFTEYVLKATSLSIPLDGHPGNGLDVDNNPATCSPSSACSGGVDNSLATLGPLANESLEEAIENGSINLLFQISEFANGEREVAGYIGELADGPNCTDINDPAQICSYDVNPAGISLSDRCLNESLITLPVEVNGVDTPPSATANGAGGDGTTFVLALAFGGFDVQLSIQNVEIQLNLTHDGSDVSAGSGLLAGGVPVAYIREAIRALKGQCIGGTNAGAECTNDGQCNSNSCVLAQDQSPEEL
ncbi:MAG TPA: hypothetical protein VEB21_13205, partial [Terriglobales bacterium]|nr:hypothetical protein [Terriglobales bacterium]